MKKVFITRTLTDKSVFKQELEAKGFVTEGSSMVKFSGLDFKLENNYDWLFFYSKNAVKYFFKKVKPEQISGKKIACFGSSTAKSLEAFKLKADFFGKGDSNRVAKDFLEEAKGSTVLFARAQSSLKSIQTKISNETAIVDVKVYKNVPKENPQGSDADFLVFTSPMNAENYFAHHKADVHQKIIAIGKTTGNALVNLCKHKVYVSDKSTEENLVKMVHRVTKLTQKRAQA